ncbi:hypothetical protein KOM00_15560 [Geomonas sp. Red69]|uniref:Uncharacterized protein n=1 Tax=Geomonas diazotrophica TaxID=2843197 RepID=A0ABX8JEG6_9BACT|nr:MULTISPECIES: hypothetical protein [Geomonas]MBU5638147.1 hypothetical protein [Geomonas diazotrophica]QWV95867.1 hypothetical protein KP005_10745 [Geomonas nitrogeniifigens]QXE84953.1 hypothetical protein KP003_11120 [Geomonas nitrogeniifigens]
MQRLCDSIRVAAIFAPGAGIRPVWFEWRRQKRAVTRLSYFWTDSLGGATRLHFAVCDDSNLYELMYDTSDQNWTLVGVEEQ